MDHFVLYNNYTYTQTKKKRGLLESLRRRKAKLSDGDEAGVVLVELY